MAQTRTIHYVSDLSNKDIIDNDFPTVSFGWDGTDYEVDLTTDEAEKFYKAMEKYISVSRKASKASGVTRTKGKANQDGPSAAEVRAWAQSNGYDVPERGRIPQTIRDAYDSAS
jgi:hypothetical protein